MNTNINFRNPIKAEIVRANGDVEEVPLAFNGVTLEGFDHLLGVGFRNQALITTWFMGLITSAGGSPPVVAESDTMASNAWSETTTYGEANRPTWTPAVVTQKSIANSAAVVFTFNGAADIRGIFITSDNTKGGTAGKLWATALFNANMVFADTEILRLIYTINIASA